jgi:NitT/TauT family transport system permease protein
MASNTSAAFAVHHRPEIEYNLEETAAISEVARPLSLWERIWGNSAVRHVTILVLFGLAWELASRYADNPLIFPSLSDSLVALFEGLKSGVLVSRIATSLEVLLLGYAIALAVALVFTVLAVTSSFGADVLTTFTSMFNPLPALAILPLALLWLGIGMPGLILVMVQSVVWTIAINTFTGFQSVPRTLRMAGQNFGFSGVGYVFRILIPAAFPSILTGLKIGWAHAWRTLIGAELVFGVASRSGGLGWYIYENRAALEIANVFAGLLTVIAIGFIVENLIFRTIERKTIRRWGMVS